MYAGARRHRNGEPSRPPKAHGSAKRCAAASTRRFVRNVTRKNATKRKARSFAPAGYTPGRFRRDTVDVVERERLTAKIGEICIARQMVRSEGERE